MIPLIDRPAEASSITIPPKMKNPTTEIRVGRSMIPTVYALTDMVCLVLGLAATQLVVGHRLAESLVVTVVGIVAYRLMGGVTRLYHRCRGADLTSQIVSVLGTWCLSLVGLLVVGTLVDARAGLDRHEFVVWSLVVTSFLVANRIVLYTLIRRFLGKGLNRHGFAVVGVTEIGIQLAKNIQSSAHLGLELIGFYDDRPAERTADLPDEFPDKLGDLDSLVEQARCGRVNTIFITFPIRAEERTRNVLGRLSDSTVSVYIVPDFFVYELLHCRWDNFRGLPVVSVFETPLYGVDSIVKRMLDVVLGGLCLCVAGVPMLLISVAIKVTSSGPVFFRQRRYGLDGQEIRVWKFRSMRVMEDGDTFVQATQNDGRVTPLGAIL